MPSTELTRSLSWDECAGVVCPRAPCRRSTSLPSVVREESVSCPPLSMRGWTRQCSTFRLAPVRVSRGAPSTSPSRRARGGDLGRRCWRGGPVHEVSQDKGDAERRHELEEPVDAHEAWPGFDLRDADLADSQLLAELNLGETALLAQGAKVHPELICQPNGIVHDTWAASATTYRLAPMYESYRF